MRTIFLIPCLVGLAACSSSEPMFSNAGNSSAAAPASAAPATAPTPEAATAATPAPTPAAAPAATVVPASTGGLRLGSGYRAPNDSCRRAGVNDVTASFSSTQSDLVACPISFAGRPAFIKATFAREVVRAGDYVVYTVPLFGAAPVTNIPNTPPITGG